MSEDKNVLAIGGKNIRLDNRIREKLEFRNQIVIIMYDKTIVANNVVCFDKQGNELWRINDILNIRKPIGYVKIEKEDDYILSVYSSLGIVYRIDVANRFVLERINDSANKDFARKLQMALGASDDTWEISDFNADEFFKKTTKKMNVKWRLLWGLVAFIGLVLIGVGALRVSYSKTVENREKTTVGTVYNSSGAQVGGRRMGNYYSLYVKYEIDGVKYKGYFGKTATKPVMNSNVTVHYDPKHPEKILNYDDMSEYTFRYFLFGIIMFVVGGVLVIDKGNKKKVNPPKSNNQ